MGIEQEFLPICVPENAAEIRRLYRAALDRIAELEAQPSAEPTDEQIAIKETAALLKPMQDFEAAKRADLQVVDEPDWSHPKLQALLSTKARQSMIISLAESLLDGDDDWTGTDWDYEHDIHRKIRKLMDGTTVTDEQQPAAWLHSARPEADVITDAVKRVWENIPPKMEQYSIPLYTRKQSSAEANPVQVTDEQRHDMRVVYLKACDMPCPENWQESANRLHESFFCGVYNNRSVALKLAASTTVTDEDYTPGRKYDTQNGFKADIRYLVNGYLCGHIRCEEAATGIITFHWTLDGMVVGADPAFDLVHPRAALTDK